MKAFSEKETLVGLVVLLGILAVGLVSFHPGVQMPNSFSLNQWEQAEPRNRTDAGKESSERMEDFRRSFAAGFGFRNK